MVVWKWAFCALVLLFWVLMYRGIWWQGLVVDAVVIGGLLVAGRLPPSAGLQAVEVRPEGLRLRFADELEPALLGWATSWTSATRQVASRTNGSAAAGS